MYIITLVDKRDNIEIGSDYTFMEFEKENGSFRSDEIYDYYGSSLKFNYSGFYRVSFVTNLKLSKTLGKLRMSIILDSIIYRNCSRSFNIDDRNDFNDGFSGTLALEAGKVLQFGICYNGLGKVHLDNSGLSDSIVMQVECVKETNVLQ